MNACRSRLEDPVQQLLSPERKNKATFRWKFKETAYQFRNLLLDGSGFLSLPVSLMERHRGQKLLSQVVLLNSEDEALEPKGERRSFNMDPTAEPAPTLLLV